jgi:hypothetical protein
MSLDIALMDCQGFASGALVATRELSEARRTALQLLARLAGSRSEVKETKSCLKIASVVHRRQALKPVNLV